MRTTLKSLKERLDSMGAVTPLPYFQSQVRGLHLRLAEAEKLLAAQTIKQGKQEARLARLENRQRVYEVHQGLLDVPDVEDALPTQRTTFVAHASWRGYHQRAWERAVGGDQARIVGQSVPQAFDRLLTTLTKIRMEPPHTILLSQQLAYELFGTLAVGQAALEGSSHWGQWWAKADVVSLDRGGMQARVLGAHWQMDLSITTL